MPFSRRRRTYRKKRSVKVSPKVKRYVKKAVHAQVENKYKLANMSVNFASVGNSWTELELSAMSQGTGEGQRVGNQITLRGVHFRGTLVGGQSNLATDDNRNTFRIVLALWDQTSATPLATNGANIDSYIAKTISTGNGLIKKYFDRVIELSSPGRDSTGYLPAIRLVSKFAKVYSKIHYSGSTSTTGGKRLILSMISDSAAVSHPGFTQGGWQLWYEDA